MKLLLNDKEIANYLAGLIDYHSVANQVPFLDTHLNQAIAYAVEEKEKRSWNKKKKKVKDKIKSGIQKDLELYVRHVQIHLKTKKEQCYNNIHKNIETIVAAIGSDLILNNYKQDISSDGFIKSTGFFINSQAKLIRRKEFSNVHEDCLLRNTVGNEEFLISKIDNHHPFWFIDSGYTNFLESNKKWHRLVRNHLHYGRFYNAPVDRLQNFSSFPKQWRESGDKILIIEPGHFAANIFHVDLAQWKNNVVVELRQHTDRPIVFREKSPKKTREPLFNHLLDEDYYCVISINSNAATEAIWAGIPAITLDTHITNAVTCSKLSEINVLYRGPLASWLAMLSYNQFTYDELKNGTAVEITRKYNG